MPDPLETPLLELVTTLNQRYTPPEYIPGCEVKSITDISEYSTNNGWIEAICGQHNQQRVRYKAYPAGVAVNDFIDVLHFPDRKVFEVYGSGGTASITPIKTDRLISPDGAINPAISAYNSGNIVIPSGGSLSINAGTATSSLLHIDRATNNTYDAVFIENSVSGGTVAGTQVQLQVQNIAERSTILRQNGGSGTQDIGGALDTILANTYTSSNLGHLIFATNNAEAMRVTHNGDVGIGVTPSAQLHVDQAGTAAAEPVLYLDQADVSEEFVRFDAVDGVGNSVESAGGKSLTHTVFLRVNVNGTALYWGVGTIA